jgi:hypothetical protein
MSRKRIADLHARLTADVTQYDSEMKRAAAITSRTQRDVSKTMVEMRRQSMRFGMGMLGAGSAALLLANHVRGVIRDIDDIPGLDPKVVGSINEAKAMAGGLRDTFRQITAIGISKSWEGFKELSVQLSAMTIGVDAARAAWSQLEAEAARYYKTQAPYLNELRQTEEQLEQVRLAYERLGMTRAELVDVYIAEGDAQNEIIANAKDELELNKALLKQGQAYLAAHRERLALAREGSQAIKTEADEFAKAMATMWSTVSDRAGQEFADMVITGRAAFGSLADIAARAMLEIASRMAIINPMLNAVFGGFSGFTALPAFFKIPGFADGGRPQVGQVSMVGERGPEFFVPDRPGTVLSAGQTASALRGGGGGVSVVQNITVGSGVQRAELMPILRQNQQELIATLSDMQRRGA